MKLRRLSNKEIDRSKYDETVLQKGNARMYFLSAYLDATCHDWEVIICGDYDAVMPIPYAPYFILGKKHDVPLYVQQLGIIGLSEDQVDLKGQFIKLAQSIFRKYIYSFSHENEVRNVDGLKLIKRTNYELDLHQSYDLIKSNYSNNLIRNLKTSEGEELEFKKLKDFEILKSFIFNHSKVGDPSPRKINTINKIYNIDHPAFESDVYSAWMGDEPVAICFAPRFQNRITLLIPRSNDRGRQMNAMAFLIDQIIQSHAGSDVILDFEGSMLPGVSQFYKSFGAAVRGYAVVSGYSKS